MLMASSGEYCLSCHKEKIGFSHLKSMEEWKELTMDGGEVLKKMHKRNPNVVEYINSGKYSEDEVFKMVNFFAYGTKEQSAYRNLEACKKCHGWKIGTLRTKSEWYALSSSLEALIKVHKGNREALELIGSDAFKDKKTLDYFIKKISFHAPEDVVIKRDKRTTKKITSDINLTKPSKKQMHQVKSKKFDFEYDTENMSDKAAKKVLFILKKKFKMCKTDDEVYISLYYSGSKEHTVDAIISALLTLGIAPIRYDNTWIMKVKNKKNVFYAAVNVISVRGPMSNAERADKDKEHIEDKVTSMIDEIMAKPEFKCGTIKEGKK